MKECKDCQNSFLAMFGDHYGSYTFLACNKDYTIDMYGEVHDVSCESVRKDEKICGPDAKLFTEQK